MVNIFSKLKVNEVQPLTYNSKRVEFDVPPKLKFSFQSGQYITVRRNFNNIEERRSYSICSSENEPLAIGVKRVHDGLFSNYIFDELKPGMTLEVMGPNGRFIKKNEAKLLMVAAGSGITPIISIISSTLKNNTSAEITLLYGNKTIESIMFHKELDNLKDIFLGRLNVIHILSKQGQDVELLNGRIDQHKVNQLILKKMIDLEVEGVFICGPDSMINNVSDTLIENGLNESKINTERFYLGRKPKLKKSERTEVTAEIKSNIAIILDGTHRTFVFDKHNDNIIDAAQAHGIDVPFSCKGGMCCTCRCKITKGDVTMKANFSLEDWEMEAGFVLACQAVPQTEDIVLDFDAS